MAIVPLDVTTQVRMRMMGVARLTAPTHRSISVPDRSGGIHDTRSRARPTCTTRWRCSVPAAAAEVGLTAHGGGNERHVHAGKLLVEPRQRAHQ